MLRVNRHYGTVLANLNFELDKIIPKNQQRSTIFSQLQADFTDLLDSIIPSSQLSLTDFLGMLGYSSLNSKYIDGLQHLESLDSIPRNKCNVKMFFEHWNKYFNSMQIGIKGTNSNKSVPCATKETEEWPIMHNCCDLFDPAFDRKNIQRIMKVMKHSLDVSNPWIFQYLNTESEFKGTNDVSLPRSDKSDNGLSKLIQRNSQLHSVQGWW